MESQRVKLEPTRSEVVQLPLHLLYCRNGQLASFTECKKHTLGFINAYTARYYHICKVTGNAPSSTKPVTFVSDESGSGQKRAELSNQAESGCWMSFKKAVAELRQEVPSNCYQLSQISEGCSACSQTHLPLPQSMSSFVEFSEESDSVLLPCSCSASWKLHSIAIKVIWSSGEKRKECFKKILMWLESPQHYTSDRYL